MTEPFRIAPAMPVTAYKSYEMRSPISTHTRPATCAEVECDHWRNGWVTKIDLSTALGQRQAKYIVEKSERYWTSEQNGDLVTFHFSPGQECFSEHRVSLDREPLFVVRGGDWRGNPTGERRQHASAADWVEDFALHQNKIQDEINRG